MGTGTVNAAVGGRAVEPGSGAGPAPLQSHLTLGALPGAVPCGRLHVRHVVREWGLDKAASDAELIASELITNAVQASEGLAPLPVVRLWVACNDASVLVIVWDANPDPPVAQDPGTDEGGRGLTIVEALSEDWGWYCAEGGKFVWSRVAP